MVGVAEDELQLLLQRSVVDGFECGIGGDGDEAGGVDDAVRGMQATDAGERTGGSVDELEAEEGSGFVGREGRGWRRFLVRIREGGRLAAAFARGGRVGR